MGDGPTQTQKHNASNAGSTRATMDTSGSSQVSSRTNTSQYGNTSAVSNPWAPSIPILTGILDQSGKMLPNAGRLSDGEAGAIEGIGQTADEMASLNPEIQSAARGMLSGGGVGSGREMITSGHDKAREALDPYVSGSMLDFSNPQLQEALGVVRDDVTNQVGGMFADAGRSFSGAHSGALGRGIASAEAPMLLDYLYRQQGNQIDAARTVGQMGIDASGALDQSHVAENAVKSAAPGMLTSMLTPWAASLEAERYGADTPINRLGMLSDLVLPIAHAGGTQEGTSSIEGSSSTNANTRTQGRSRTSGRSTGRTSGTTTTSQEYDPLSTALGLGFGGLGMLSRGENGGLGGMLGRKIGTLGRKLGGMLFS